MTNKENHSGADAAAVDSARSAEAATPASHAAPFDSQSIDASVWTEAFLRMNPPRDFGTMVGWFANAIMAGYDEADRRHERYSTWQPIATAPKDGTPIVAVCEQSTVELRVVVYKGRHWVSVPGGWCSFATHWMPLPPVIANADQSLSEASPSVPSAAPQ